jgi:hypothetical protein
VIEPLKTIYELLEKLLLIREIRRKKLFDEFIKPTFDNFLDVHQAYRQIFFVIRDGIASSRTADEKWSIVVARGMTIDEAIESHSTLKTSYAALIQQVNELREDSDQLRNDLRSSTSNLLKLFDKPEEQRFLVALATYFIDESDHPSETPQSLDFVIGGIIEDSSASYLPTPSKRLIWDLERAIDDRKALDEVVTTALERLDKRYFLVMGAYTELRYVIVSNSAASDVVFKAKDGKDK